MIRSVAEAVAAERAGRTWSGFYRRGGPAMTANIWADLSYASGIPVANYYASTPLVAATLSGADGINLGPEPATGLSKYVRKALLLPPTATGILQFEFVDIVMYYPFVDGDGGTQPMINNITIPRYSGHGCRIMVVSQGIGTATVGCTITYTNSDGVSGRQVTSTLNLATNAGSLCSSHAPAISVAYPQGPFIPLCATGCKGVRSIENIEYLAPGGGIQAFVIVKPLFAMSMFEATVAPIEVDFLADRTLKMPEIPNGSYLSAIARGTTTQTPATIIGQIDTVWG